MTARRAHIDLLARYGAAGTVKLPGSKSISNRILLLAALATGDTEIRDLLRSEDTERMLDALSVLGIRVSHERDKAVCRVVGAGGRFPVGDADLFLGNAGTAFRPLTAALALAGGHYRLSGVQRMHERPIGDLVDALRGIGADIRYLGADGFPPIEIFPGTIKIVGPVRVRGDASSQFLTALLMALPLAGVATVIEVVGELISKPYIEITLNLMARFGVRVEREGWQSFSIAAAGRYQSPGTVFVEGDASGASYFLAAGVIGGGPVRVEGVGKGSIQGDVRFADVLASLGARIAAGDNSIEARSPERERLKAFDLDLNHIPDAAMTLAVVALFCDGTSTLRNIASWRVKETDRLAAMSTELRKLGAVVKEGPDYLTVTPPANGRITPGAEIDTYDDHRMAMCFSLAALAGVPVRINDPDCVAKTFPDYFERFRRMTEAPVIAIDGPSGSGKGTVAQRVAQWLGFHYLDSGALYRLVALAALRGGVSLTDPVALSHLAAVLPAEFAEGEIFLARDRVTESIRTEEISNAASQLAQIPEVRQALMDRQRAFRRAPGLVADGRDMSTVVFPDAVLKVFLTASVQARAERRYKQLIDKGLDANLATLLRDIEQRDVRDSSRSVAPLRKSAGAQLLDTTGLTIDEGVALVVRWFTAAHREAPSL